MRRPALDGECYTEAEWHRNAKRTRDAVPNLWSLDVALRQSPGVDAVLRIMLHEGLALSRSAPFLVALARMISLPVHPHTQAKASEMSPFEWDRKAWSREHFFASVGMALDPGNAVLAAALWALMAVAKAVHEPACYRSVCTDGSSRGCYTYIRVLVNLGIIRVPVHSSHDIGGVSQCGHAML